MNFFLRFVSPIIPTKLMYCNTNPLKERITPFLENNNNTNKKENTTHTHTQNNNNNINRKTQKKIKSQYLALKTIFLIRPYSIDTFSVNILVVGTLFRQVLLKPDRLERK